VPYPPDRGDKIRSFNILKRLMELAPVHVASFADNASDLSHAEHLRPRLASLHVEQRKVSRPVGALKALATGKPISLTLFDSKGMRAAVATVMAEHSIDAIVVFSGQMAQFVPADRGAARFVMDFGDVDSAKFAAYAKADHGLMRLIHAREARRLGKFEIDVAHSADVSTFVSETEAQLFRSASGLETSEVCALENGIDCNSFDPRGDFERLPEPENPLLVFTGQMDYRPNIEAVTSFARGPFAVIRAARPDAQFAIVGRNPTRDVQALADLEGVQVTGSVPDIRSWLDAADVVVGPLRIARGIQNKILEAMAMAKPVVVSPAAFEGIAAESGKELVVAPTLEEEAASVLALLADPEKARKMGEAGRERMCSRYDWSNSLAPLAAHVGISQSSAKPDTVIEAAA
jgi:sugar transferase (PEP-CTERM/EpsH1 system associated)